MKSWQLRIVVIAALATLVSVNSWAGEREIVLREHLKRTWTNELLTYPSSAPENACHPDSVTQTARQVVGPVASQHGPIGGSDAEGGVNPG